eukprot:Platyproteum_vivax@DN3613_c0_g1_i1.p1
MGMTVTAGAVPGSKKHRDDDVPRVPLYQCLPKADFISLHCPLTDDTYHMVNDHFLQFCKPTSVIINTARGGLIDEVALMRAADNGTIDRAYLDVLVTEPPTKPHPLIHHPKILVTPHASWATIEAKARLIHEATLNVKDFQDGKRRNRVD